MASIPLPRLLTAVVAVVATCAAGMAVAAPATAVPQRSALVYAAPNGHGRACTRAVPCGLPDAQHAVRSLRAAGVGSVTVLLAGGTYALAAPLQLSAPDSGRPGHPVVWRAASGARPVISGARRVRTWRATGTNNVWSATVPAGSATRQLYLDGAELPIAQSTPGKLGFSGGWSGSSTGYDLSGDTAALAFFRSLTPEQVAQVQFDYPRGNGDWTDTKCGVSSLSGTSLVMDQPCWANATNRASFNAGSGGLPSMYTGTMPATISNARSLLQPGQWFLDRPARRLYLRTDGPSPAAHDVELPRLETLLQGAGTLSHPLHDVTFSGITFSYATWNAPSNPSGFADVQSNLHMTGDTNQGLCTFSDPAGTCPWGSLTEPHANVSFTASDRITLSGNRFANLGGAGLRIAYGSSHNLVQGNEFTDIASTAVLLGCTADPTPINPDPVHFPDYSTTNPDTPQVIEQGCTPNPAAVRSDHVGANEIASDNTISDNIVHDVGTDYRSASGITLLFSRGTTVTHNELYDLPYTAITAGVIQGHIDLAAHPDNSLNINADNTISDNLMHDYLQVLADGGAIYIEGHQASYHYQDATTIDYDRTLAHGLQVTGNVAYNQGAQFFTYYDDAGSEWVRFAHNVEFHPNTGLAAQGGCSATGHFTIDDNWFADAYQSYACTSPIDTHASGNQTIPVSPGPSDVPSSVLVGAGPRGRFRPVVTTARARADYISPPQQVTVGGTATTQVLIGGINLGLRTPVYFNGTRATSIRVLSAGFLVATAPRGSDGTGVALDYVAPPVITAPADRSVHVGGQALAVSGAGVTGDTVTVSEAGSTVCTARVVAGKWSCRVRVSNGVHLFGAVQENTAGTTSEAATTRFVFGTPAASVRVNDTDPGFTYTNMALYSSAADYQGDVHGAFSAPASATYTFYGTGIKVYGEQNAYQGNIGITVDGGAQAVVNTNSSTFAGDVAVWTSPTLSAGFHTITVSYLTGQEMTFDGVEVLNAS